MLPGLLSLLVSNAAAASPDASDADDDVVVEGRRSTDDPDVAATSVTVVKVDERLPDGADVADVVARSPSATIRRLGGLGAFSAVSLRGAALRQVQVHLDGIPLNPDGSSAIDLSALPLRAFGAVHVYRGAGPAWLAAAPIGGVVDLRTSDAAEAPLSLAVSGGSWHSGRLQSSGATRAGKVHVLGAVDALTSRSDFRYVDDKGNDDALDDTLARRVYNDRHQVTALARLRAGTSERGWTALALATAREEGLPGAVRAPTQERLRSAWGLGAVEARTARAPSWAWTRAWLQGRDERRTLIEGQQVDERQLQAGLVGVGRTLTRWAELGLTTQIRHDLRLATPEHDAASRWSGTLTADAVWRTVGALRVEPVLQLQGWRDQSPDLAVSNTFIAPRLAAALPLSGTVMLHAAGGRAVRPPDFVERFGNRGATQGRPDLRPERAWWADLGARWRGESVAAEVTAFVNDAEDRIVFIQNSQWTVVPINVGRSRIAGVEAGLDGSKGLLEARATASLTHSVVRSIVPGEDGQRLPRVPIGTMLGDVGMRLPHGVRVGWTTTVTAGNRWDTAGLVRAPARVLHGAFVRAHPKPGWPAVSIEVRNLADTLTQSTRLDPTVAGSLRVPRPVTDFTGYPLPGRTWLASLSWSPKESAP